MLHDETQTENHLERPLPLPLQPVPQDAEIQRKRMLIALGILLVALAAVVLKDWDFWFPPGGEDQEATTQSKSKGKSTAAVPASTPATPARERKLAAKSSAPAAAATTAPFAVTAERAVLPPLQVEVVAGNRHINLPAKSNAIHLDVGSGATSSASGASAPAPNAPVSAGDRVQLSPQTTQSVSVSVPPDYPLLARQMKVQGAVSLQALISREGTIQELQILSGPGILAAAAREAVKQWHFKPYILNGQPVETQARITVNFTISTN
ncbi:MAG TPA: energy transducer TonB [Terriglobales bacterium]|nr:energy transducer TonB [Terriglobales bacterium]